MSEHTQTPSSEPSAGSQSLLGETLRQAREAKGLAIGEVAERLKLTAKQVEALELGRYEELPEPVFVRGFVRTYARFLNLVEADVLAQLDTALPMARPAVSAGAERPERVSQPYHQQTGKKPFPKTLLFALLAVALGGGIYAWQSKSGQQRQQQDNQASAVVGQVLEPNLPASNVTVVPMGSTTPSASGASAVVAASTASAPATASAVAATPGELVINIRYRSKLVVTDGSGKELQNSIVGAGSEHKFNGQPPYNVRIGYASGSTVLYQGQPVDLSGSLVEGKTAALTVPKP